VPRMPKLALIVATAFVLSACGGSDEKGDQSSAQSGPRTMTIWLMEGSAPPKVVDAVNAEWKKAHPNDTVKVELQQWNNITTKLDAAFAGSSPPDVVERARGDRRRPVAPDRAGVDQLHELTGHLAGEVAPARWELDDDVVDGAK